MNRYAIGAVLGVIALLLICDPPSSRRWNRHFYLHRDAREREHFGCDMVGTVLACAKLCIQHLLFSYQRACHLRSEWSACEERHEHDSWIS
jgi:hypothetical protein